jgi:hypothetical protein
MSALPSRDATPDFHAAFRGRFSSLLTWNDLDGFWHVVRERSGAGWYLYAIGLPAPTAPSSPDDVNKFIAAVSALLRKDHREDYCAIVYVDSKENPTFIKIFDPNHLGTSCGSSKNPPLPGWILSLLPPSTLADKRPLPEGRRRWWNGLWEQTQVRDTRGEGRG